MYNNWSIDLNDSVKSLESIKHTFLPKLINGKIYTIEHVDNDILMIIDKYSGIDYIRHDNNGLQGIAARVQWGHTWNTFTIRSERHTGTKTELNKRLFQIENGYLYPEFTLQAYFDNKKDNNLLSIAVIKTKKLYELYLNKPELFNKRKSDNEFIFIEWTKIKEFIKIIENKP